MSESREISVLIVDDSAADAELAVRALNRDGLVVKWARVQDRDALQLALEATWDLILSDHDLPGFDAFGVLTLIQERRQDLPCIVVSAAIDHQTAVEAMRAGARDYVLKDNLERLPAAVRRELHDVAARTDQTRRTDHAEHVTALLHATFQSGGDAVAIVERRSRRVVFVNPAWELLNDQSSGEVVGHDLRDVVGDRWDQAVLFALIGAVQGGQDRTVDTWVQRRGADSRAEVELRIEMLRADRGDPTHFVVVLHDITERKAHLRELERLALFDSLTGLPNRAGFERAASDVLAQARSAGAPASLLIMELERFQDVNVTFGHEVGDQLLRAVVPRLRAELRAVDVLAHQRDEFLMLLPGLGAEAALAVARTLMATLDNSYELERNRVDVGSVFGVAVFPEHGESVGELMRRADVALYAAKAGDSGVSLYDPACDLHSVERHALVSELRQAVETRALVLHYQPVVHTRSRSPAGVEALVRWPHPTRGLVPPLDFIPMAERTGLIVPLTELVLRAAVAQAVRWNAQGIRLRVSVNVSTRSLYDSGLSALVREALRDLGLQPKALVIEITEGSIMTRPAEALATMRELRALGVDLSIDDFGTGYSSLAYLKDLPVTSLKIDRSFVGRMLVDASSRTIVRSTIDLAHNLGLKVVAEGVEDRATLGALAELGCDLAQGYFMCRPVPAPDLERWYRAQRTLASASAVAAP